MPLGEPAPLDMDRFRTGATQPSPAPAMPAPQPAPDARGTPVYVQTPQEMESDRRTLRRAALLLLGLIPLFGLVFYLVTGWFSVCVFNIVVLLLLTACMFGGLAAWTLYASTRVKPWRMYEDGVAFTTYPNLVDRYYLYANINQIKEISDNVGGNMVAVRWPGLDGINLHMDNPRTPEIVAFLRRKMGAPGEPGQEPARPLQEIALAAAGTPTATTFQPEPFRYEKHFYVAGLLVALLVSLLLIYIVPPASRGRYWFLPLALFPTMAVNCLAVTTILMGLYVRARKLPVKFDLKLIVSILVVLNLITAAELSVADPVSDALDVHSVELVQTPAPGGGVALADTVAGQVLELNGSLLVAAGRTVSLDNCTVRFHCNTPRQYSLWVAPGGRLLARNCTFSAVNPGKGFGCEFHGPAVLEGCSFDGVWGDPERENGDGGVEIWDGNVSLRGCRIANAATNGLFIARCDPVIADSTVTACGDENVEMHRSAAVFTNCSFSSAGWGIIAWDGSYLRMEGCRVSDIREDGVDLAGSRGEVRNCTMQDIGGSAIELDDSELVSYSGTTFSNVGERISESEGLGLNLLTCLAMNVMLSVLTVVNVFMSGRRRSVVSR